MTTDSLFTKCKMVVDSCETQEQLDNARTFIDLAYTFDDIQHQLLLNRLHKKADELKESL